MAQRRDPYHDYISNPEIVAELKLVNDKLAELKLVNDNLVGVNEKLEIIDGYLSRAC